MQIRNRINSKNAILMSSYTHTITYSQLTIYSPIILQYCKKTFDNETEQTSATYLY